MKGRDDLAEGEAPSRYIKTEEITEVPGFLEARPKSVANSLATIPTPPPVA